MTVNDARKIIAVMLVSYPNFKPIDTELMATTWADMLKEYSYEQLIQSLGRHLDMLKRQMAASLEGNYDEEVRIFDESENQIMELADYLTEGLLQQFYRS